MVIGMKILLNSFLLLLFSINNLYAQASSSIVLQIENGAGGMIYLDNGSEAIGELDNQGNENIGGLTIGSYKITIKKAGYQDFIRDVAITSELSTVVTGTMQPISKPVTAGKIILYITNGANAAVYLDGSLLGYLDRVGEGSSNDLPFGPYWLQIRKEGFKDFSKYITLNKSQEVVYGVLGKIIKQYNGKSGGAPASALPPADYSFLKEYLFVFFIGASFIILIVILIVVKKRSGDIKTPMPVRTSIQFGEYLLESSPFKKGGMSKIYRCTHPKKSSMFVMKIPDDQKVKDSQFKSRFLDEAKLGSELLHENIIRIYDWGEVNGVPFFVMEYFEGKNVRELLNKHKIFPENSALDVIEKACHALNYAHMLPVPIIHKDIKPENIMIKWDMKQNHVHEIKLIDYGISRIHDAGVVSGTPPYISPEQANGERLDGRSDIFSLGIVLYEMLFGIKLFNAPTMREQLNKIRNFSNPSFPDRVNPDLVSILRKMLAKEKEKRYQNAKVAIQDITTYKFKYHL